MRKQQISPDVQALIEFPNPLPHILPTLPVYCFIFDTIDSFLFFIIKRVKVFALVIAKIDLSQSFVFQDRLSRKSEAYLSSVNGS
jgi:hypothetical protein